MVSQQTFGEFSIIEVLSRSAEILFRNIVPFGVISIVFYSIPTALLSPSGPGDSIEDFSPANSTEALPDVAGGAAAAGFGLAFVFIFLLSLVLSQFVTATFVYGTVQDLRGQRASIGECLNRALAVAVPVALVALLASFAMMIGMMLLIIPGFFVMVLLYVAIPVAVIERPGIIASLGRSAELTKGFRWKVFGMLAILFILAIVIGGVIGFVTGALGLVGGILEMIINAFFTALFAVVSAVTYVALRQAKEGMDIDQIAAVFD